MSSADPGPQRPHPAAYALAVLLPLLLLGLIVTPVAVLGSRAGVTVGDLTPGAEEGGRGVGDPYFPDFGSGGYDALSSTLDLNWDPTAERLSGTAVLRARATTRLGAFFVDLALPASAVTVDGAPAEHRLSGFSDLRIDPPADIEPGATFAVEITYAGQPAALRRGETTAWYETGREWTVAGEPESSAWWYPANDHPSDPATLDVSVRVPAGMEAVSTGVLVSRDTADEAGFDTWRWVTRQPAVTYTTFLSLGDFEIRQGSAGGRPYVYAVTEQLSPPDRRQAFAELAKTPRVVAELEEVFGRYPFDAIGGIVPAADLDFAGLEAQTRPLYQQEALLDGGADRLVVHELAHMWFGNSVTLRQWNDIFLNEGYASWAEWAYAERTGGRTGAEILRRTYAATRNERGFWRVTMSDPGPGQLFTTVYVRGPMTVQALRNVIGEAAFARLTRDWASRPGPRSVEEWMAAAQGVTPVDLGPFFDAWIFGTTAPEPTAANGLG